MDERRDPQTDAPDEGELLAAYLAAETDDLTSARIERQLLEDPEVADRLDALARTRQRLQRLDDVQPPPDFRARLDARLRAERAARAEPGSGAHTAGAHAGGRSARTAGDRSHRGRTFDTRWFPPLAAAAALVVVAVIGGTVLLNMSAGTSSQESAGSAADTAVEAEGPVAEPFAAPDSGGEGAEGAEGGDAAAGGEAAQQELSDRAEQDAGGPDAAAADALPRVAADADITTRLLDQARSTNQPAVREAELRRRSGLPARTLCLTTSAATAVDLVERDGRAVLTALVAEGSRSRVVLFDPGDCARLRAFAP